MFMVLILNKNAVWAGLPFIYGTMTEAWDVASEQPCSARIVEIRVSIEKPTPRAEGLGDA